MPDPLPDPEARLRTIDAARFRTIFEAEGLAIMVLDSGGVIVEGNRAMAGLIGYTVEELRGMSVLDITHPDDVGACWENFQDLLAGRRSSYHMEKRYLRRDGQRVWSALTASVIPDESDGPKFIIAIVENIAERKQAEELLRSSREHLEASVRASNTGLWDWNLKTNEVYYSPEWKSQLGYEESEIGSGLGEWESRLHPADRQRTIATALNFLQNPWPNYEMEFRMQHKDSSYRWILSRASVLQGPDGHPWRMLGSHVDITDRKQSEERLREYAQVVEGLQEMIAVVDSQYRYRLANRAFLSYREMEKEQVVGHLIPEVLDRDVFEKTIKPRVDECLEGKVVRYEMSYRYPKLGERQLSVTYLPIEGPLGIDQVAVVLEDTTLRRRAERDLRETHEQLTTELQERTRAEQRVRALSDRLLSAQEEERRNIARELHDDLSQEVAALSIAVSNLKRDIPGQDQELRRQTDAIHQRIARLGDGVRHLARQLHPAVLEYSGIAAALKSFGAEFGAVNGIGISVEASGAFEDVPSPVGLCLYRVAQEALQNVAKHSKAAKATVRIARAAGSISLVVQDAGQGFQDTRASAERGLGLVSMGERVRLANGTLNINSTVGEGTKVTVVIPC